MIQIRNENQLKLFLNKVLLEVIESVADDVRKKLQKHILDDAYKFDYFPNKEYEDGSGEPSWEFLESYRWKKTVEKSNILTKELFNNWQAMSINKASGRHWENGKDMRKKLAELLNTSGVFGHKVRNSYWDNFIEEMDKEINIIFKQKLRSYGLNVV